ncbi:MULTISPECIES: VWA domain-containing protein [Arcobacteraceae]|uniref:VWA domain-containing protein n=1 Tax=Poseidonibacter parvus TaxID=1850254 RepID=A0A1P8KK75_9BACT|nr:MULTISPECIES: VWA domain-containing protein [Arcobacteraceae]APW64957.1 VWA domain-containing protein [Poseidonibacter parvus]
MFNNLSFEFPYLLLLILVFIFCSIYCKAKTPSYLIPHLNIFQKSNEKSSLIMNLLKFSIITLSIIALASPVKNQDTQLIKNDGINILLDLDASGSMNYNDLDKEDTSKNRFDVVKDIVKDFIKKRPSDNIGLLIFGDSVMMASPLSFDKNAQREIIDYLEVGMAGKQTALIDSIARSVNILKDKKAKSNVIIVLSDGEDTASKIPLKVVIKLLKKYNIKAYTIGIGNSNKYVLNQISTNSNAKSYTAYSKEDLIDIYDDINKLEKSKIDQNKIILKDYLFFYPLFFAVLFLILYIYLKNKE